MRVAMAMHSTQLQTGIVGRPPTDLGSCVAGLVNTLAKGAAGVVTLHGLLPLDFTLLRLFLEKEQWAITQLAQVLPVNAPLISSIVTKLVDMGLVGRRRTSSDRRAVFLTLTDEGKTLTLDLQRLMCSFEAALSEGVWKEEMAAFESVTAKVMANYTALDRQSRSSRALCLMVLTSSDPTP